MTEDRHGIDKLRAAIDEVAAELEDRETTTSRAPRRWLLGVALGSAAVLVALLVSAWVLRSPGTPETSEVEVLVLRIHGRDVRARIVDDTAPATIIVMPQPEGPTPPAAASTFVGGPR